jgi:hypothetical protein
VFSVRGLPVRVRYSEYALTVEELEQWVNWLSPYLQCFGNHMPVTLSAIIDDDGMKVTRACSEIPAP